METAALIHFGVSLFSILNPIGNVPVFIAETAHERPGVRRAMALLLSLFIGLFLTLILYFGDAALKFFGITIPAFQIAGGIIIFTSGLKMLNASSHTKSSEAPMDEHGQSDFVLAKKKLVSILVPLGVPIFVGPGSIATVILHSSSAQSARDLLNMSIVVSVVCVFTALILMLSQRVGSLLGENGLEISSRLLGLVLAAIGIQFLLSGLGAATLNFINPEFIH